MLRFPHPISRHLCSLLTHNIHMLTFASIWLIALGTCNRYGTARAEQVMGYAPQSHEVYNYYLLLLTQV